MGELKEGEKCHLYTVAAVKASGFCTVQDIANHLSISRNRVLRIMKRLGIVLEPFVRNDAAVKGRVYKRVKRALTREEAESITKRYFRDVGRSVDEEG